MHTTTREADPSTQPRTLPVLGGLAAVAVALSTLFKIQGFDIWWHVATGRWIAEHAAIPTVDPFSFTAEGPWASSGAIAQLYFYAFDVMGGAPALVWSKVLLVAVLGWLVVRLARDAEGGWLAAVVVLWGLSSSFRFVVRPHLFSFIGFAVLLLLLRRAEHNRSVRPLAWIPLLVAIWCNFHRGGTLTLPVLAIASAAWAFDARLRHLALPAVATLAASTLAAMANQGGLHTVVSTFAVSASPVFARHITEWHALTPALLPSHFPAFGVALVVWVAAAIRRRRFDLEVAIVLFTAALAFSKVRFIPYPALAMVPGLAFGARELARWLEGRSAPFVRGSLVHAGLAAAAFGVLASSYLARTPLPAWGAGVAEWRVPVGAARFLKQNPPPGNMWHDFELGGYLLYTLSPEPHRVFIDGRNDKVYTPEFFERSVLAMNDPRVLAGQLEEWEIGFAVTATGRPGDERHAWLYRHPDWRLVYWDDHFAVMVRKTPASEAYLLQHGYEELRIGSTFERLVAPEKDPHAEALADEVLRNLAQAPDSARANYMAALVHRARGREAAYRDARERVRRLASARELAIELP